MRWNKEHDFSILYHEHNVDFDPDNISKIWDKMLKSERVVNYYSISYEVLNLK